MRSGRKVLLLIDSATSGVAGAYVDGIWRRLAHRHAVEAGVADRIEYRLGPAVDTIAALEGPFDLVFIDADKENYGRYYDAVIDKLAPGGIIVVDNTLWSGRVLDASDESSSTAAIRSFNDAVAADDRVVCVQLPIRDGVTLGEVCDAWRRVWGTWREQPVF